MPDRCSSCFWTGSEIAAGFPEARCSRRAEGNFLTFELADARPLAATLRERQVVVDVRGDRIRFGFGPYQEADDVDRLIERLS